MKRSASIQLTTTPAPKRRRRATGVSKSTGITRYTKTTFGTSKERKYFDVGLTSLQVSTTPSITPICVPVRGTDTGDRIGRQIKLKDMELRGYLLADADSTNNIRLIVFKFDNNAVVPVAADLFGAAGSGTYTWCPFNGNNVPRNISILWDKMYSLVSATANPGSGNLSIIPFTKFLKLNITTQFNATNGGTGADIDDGGLYFCLVSDSSVVTHPDANWVSRVTYEDA